MGRFSSPTVHDGIRYVVPVGVADFKYEFLLRRGALVAENKSLNYGLFEFHTSIQQRLPVPWGLSNFPPLL
jgi:hypothetical protein